MAAGCHVLSHINQKLRSNLVTISLQRIFPLYTLRVHFDTVIIIKVPSVMVMVMFEENTKEMSNEIRVRDSKFMKFKYVTSSK